MIPFPEVLSSGSDHHSDYVKTQRQIQGVTYSNFGLAHTQLETIISPTAVDNVRRMTGQPTNTSARSSL